VIKARKVWNRASRLGRIWQTRVDWAGCWRGCLSCRTAASGGIEWVCGKLRAVVMELLL
jgi:hypothetical protein